MNHETTEQFNQEPEDFSDAAVQRARSALDEPPQTIGPYRIIERLGAGGMGEVYRADQKEPIRRQVAIKLIKLGMDTRQVVARFEAERQALAMMDHPNIAKVFDAGTTDDGRPYFVMEYVKGVPLTEYCDSARLPLRERLKLFIPVCQAVQHAHQKGIVHRDLKPSNILICLYDGRPVPKVIDFGLAKALYQPLTEQTIYTKHGMMVGTPLYMSPEQAEHNNLDIDTRTDIYSLGVVLYELLTRSTPLEREQLRTAAYNEVLRLIKEVEPPKPSTRLSSTATLPSVAAQRGIEPNQLSRAVSGDLDWIVMKALDKERSRRYETANGFARDVERYLNYEAVEACPPTTAYRLKRFVYKHKGHVLAASAVFLALVLGLAATSWQWLRARQAENAAILSEEQAIASERKAIDARDQATLERDAKNVALIAEAAQRELADKQRDLAERQLIEGILRPIGYGEIPNTAELRSFVDWSAIPDARLKVRVLEVAFENPEIALRLARREERVIQACVGLNPTRRAQAIELMSSAQRDMQADPRIRVATAWLAIELGSTDTPALSEALAWLSNVNTVGVEPRSEFAELVSFITRKVGLLSTEQIMSGWDTQIGIFEKSKRWSALNTASGGLVAFASKLSPEKTIERAFDRVIADGAGLPGAVDILIAHAQSLSPEQIMRSADVLLAILRDSPEDMTMPWAAKGLIALSPKLDAEQGTRGGNAMIAILENNLENKRIRITNSVDAACEGLAAFASKLSPDQIARIGNLVIAFMEDDLLFWEEPLQKCLPALASKLSPDQIARSGEVLFEVLEKSMDVRANRPAVKCLLPLAPKLNPDQVTRCLDALITLKTLGAEDATGEILTVLAAKLSPDQITSSGDVVIALLEDNVRTAGGCLPAFASKLRSDQIARSWDTLLATLEKSTDASDFYWASKCLTALAPRLNPDQVSRGWDALEGSKSTYAEYAAGEGFKVLEPKLSSALITSRGDAALAVLEKSADGHDLRVAAKCLGALAPRLNPNQAQCSGDVLLTVLEKTTDGYDLCTTLECLMALTPRLSPNQRVLTAELLVKSLPRMYAGDLNHRREAAHAIFCLMPHLENQTQDRISTEALSILLHHLALSEDIHKRSEFFASRGNFIRREVIDFGPFLPIVESMVSERSIANLLQHPATIAEPREWMLQRFEELVFYNGRRVFLPLHVQSEDAVRSDELSSSAPKADPPPRRFHTIHDAAAWIQQNWPDFDLDTPFPVTWREGVRE